MGGPLQEPHLVVDEDRIQFISPGAGKMDMGVDEAGHHEESRTVDHFTTRVPDRYLVRFHQVTEFNPNDIIFHSWDEMRRLQGVGKELKEKKLVDNRPKES